MGAKQDLLYSFRGKNFRLPREKISLSFKETKNTKKEIVGTLSIKVKTPKTSAFLCHSNLRKSKGVKK